METVSFGGFSFFLRVAQGTPKLYFVVVTLQPDAGAQTPSAFRVVHVAESGSAATDWNFETPLALEATADVASSVMTAMAPGDDFDQDGLTTAEEAALGTSAVDPDTDLDGVCDGNGTGGGACSAGPDNCPFVLNGGQVNSDALAPGDTCQCGDLSEDGPVTVLDATIARRNLVGAAIGVPFDLARCNVVGPSDGGASDCDVADIFVLRRFLAGSPVTVENACDAWGAP